MVQTVILAGWSVLNAVNFPYKWDPYPFVFMNLMLSCQAAYTAPLLLITQSRQDEIDRALMQEDHQMIQALHEHLCAQDEALDQLKQTLDSLLKDKSRIN